MVPRYDRIIPLDSLTAYPGEDGLDMFMFLPTFAGKKPLRFWLMTTAESPQVEIEDVTLTVQAEVDSQPRWLDMGVTDEVKGSFNHMRITGMSPAEANRSFLVFTERTDLALQGELAEVERKLWGLARSDAGTSVLSPARVTVGQPATFTVRYSAGPKGLPPGSRLRFAVPLVFSEPQTKEPGKPGCVACQGPVDFPVEVEVIQPSIESHEANDIFCLLPKGLPAGESVALTYRTERVFLYPNKFFAADRAKWFTNIPVLGVAVAIDDRKQFVSLAEEAGHAFEVVAGPAERLHLVLPGRRRTGENLLLKGVFTDRYRNAPPIGGVIPAVDLFLIHGEEKITLGQPDGNYTDTHRFTKPLPPLKPGVYRAVAIDKATAQTVAVSNPCEVLPPNSEEPEVFWGEIHGHTEMSDGCGKYSELYRYAKQEGYLDFAAASDHSDYVSDNEWLWMQDVTNTWNKPGEFVTLVGYEWSGKQVHRNIYTSKDRLDMFRGAFPVRLPLQPVWQYFKDDKSVVGGPHGSLAHGLIWEHHEPEVERFIEMYSVWGANDSLEDNPLLPVRIRNNAISVHDVLKQGAHLGFTGGGDCHEGHAGFTTEDPHGQGSVPQTFALRHVYRCGMTAALLPALNREKLVEALRERNTYATSGARILVSFSVSGIEMGGLGQKEAAKVEATVHACNLIDEVQVIKDGEVIFRQEEAGLDASLTWEDPQAPVQEHFYYIRVIQKDGQRAWSSPVWISPVN